MKEFLTDYEEHLQAKGITPSHIQSIRFQVKEFFDFLAKEPDKVFTRTRILDYQIHLKAEAVNKRGTPLSPRLLGKRLYAVKGFFRFLTQRRLFLLNPARDLEGLKSPRPFPSYIPDHETLRRMIESIPKAGYGLRDRAIIELLYSTGIRAGELLGLQLYDIDLDQGRVLIRKGKGSKDRVVPLGEKAFQALSDYLNLERPRRNALAGKPKRNTVPPITSLFLTRSGKPVTYPALVQTLKKYRPDPRLRPHTIRHASALGMLRNGADIRYIQELLGHEHLETTQIYTRILPHELQIIHQHYHPRKITILKKELKLSLKLKIARAHLTTAPTPPNPPKNNQSLK